MEVRYTDVDYLVFSYGASLMACGILLMSELLRDLLVGFFIHNILKLCKVSEDLCMCAVIFWLFNPFTFTIGTCQNCNEVQAALWYGLIVHFRIYPIIYALPIILVHDSHVFQSGQKPLICHWRSSQKTSQSSSKLSKSYCVWAVIKSLFLRGRIKFGLISGAAFFSCTALFFYVYEWEFLKEALFYHLTRADPRQFFICFYHIHIHYEHEFSVVEKLISFLPQMIVQLVLIFCFAKDLPCCFFMQTVAFVAFNKVAAAQYFIWFFCLLPLILLWSKMKMKWEGICCMLV